MNALSCLLPGNNSEMAFGSVRHSNIAVDTKEIRLSNNLT